MKKKILVNIMFLVLSVASSFATQALYAQTFVGCHGQLRVSGNRIVDAGGQPIILRGMSMYAWATQGLQYYNATAVSRLINEWKCTVLRIPILPGNVGTQENLVKTVVDACIANGIYAIIDWHSMGGANAADCSAFMSRMATAYGNTPNVMYETWNEPVTEAWPAIKAYHQQVITAIRSIDPDNIIFCGDPQWDQNPQQAADDQITTSTNIAYVVHFYAASHGQWLRDNVTAALNKGVAIFATEYGTGTADGNGNLDTAATQAWWDFMDANGVGCANWSVSALDEESAAFKTGTSATTWTDADLKPSGVFVKNYIVTKNTPLWGACSSSSTYTPSATRTITGTPPTPTITPTSTPIPTIGVVQPECVQGSVFTIDGNLNEPGWASGTWTSVTRVVNGTVPAPVSARYKVKWDSTYLIVGVEVIDPALYNDSANYYDDDSVEVYIDANNNQSAAYAADDFQYYIGYNDANLGVNPTALHATTAGLAKTAVIAGGYSAEFRIPWTELARTPATGLTIGFDIGVNYDQNSGVREGTLMWNGTANNWQDTSAFGDAIMQACAAASPTFTRTPTRTASPTSTPTFTRTVTYSATATRTVSPVNTATNTIVFTATRTPSGTWTFTQTGTPTYTVTVTYTFTRTLTSTRTFTPTNTPTRTASPTFTESRTHTVSPSATASVSPTIFQSNTNTPTITETATGTPPTSTVTPTVTESWTGSPTDTVTDTDTATPSATATSTSSVLPTSSVSPSNTYTRTPTDTPEDTETVTPAITVSSTKSQTPSPSATASSVPSETITPTVTESRVPSPVSSVTSTATRAITNTSTAVISPTYTRTPGAAPTETVFIISDVLIAPNPFSVLNKQDAIFRCNLTQDADTLKIKIFTMGYRAVCLIDIPGSHAAGDVDATFAYTYLQNLANGVYYYIVEGGNAGGRARSKPGLLIVLR